MNATALGSLASVTYRDRGSGRRRVMRWGVRTAPILAYDEKGKLVVVYPANVVGRASAAEIKEYARTHWGRSGAGERVEGLRALEPLTEIGPALSVTYTTEKGGDADLTDYVHAFGDGAKGKWIAPALVGHACRVKRCAHVGRVAFVGGTYRVDARGIVG